MLRRQFVSLASCATAVASAPVWVRQACAQEAGLSANTLTVGCSAATTGPLASSGIDIQRGTEAAMAQINARGGIHGRTLQLLMMDDAYEPERTASNVKQMLSQGRVFALLSCFGTPNNQAILPMVVESGVPYVAPLSGASSLRKNVRNIFHVRASYTDEIVRLVQRLTSMGIKNIAVLYQDNSYGKEMLEDATRALAEQGHQPALQVAVATDGKNQADAVAQVAKVRPAAVLLATAGTVSVALVRGLRKSAPGVLLAGLSPTLPSDSLKQLGEDASGMALSMVVPDPHRAKLQLVRDYQGAMRALGYQDFTQGSLEADVNTRVLAEGLERTGRDPQQVRQNAALAAIRNWNLGGFMVDYSGQTPFVGSRFLDLGVLGSSGRFA